jgi:hypothetical protein
MTEDKPRKSKNILNSSFTFLILSKLFQGYRPSQIAAQLGVTPQAVKYHTDNMIDAGLIRKDKGSGRIRWIIEKKGLFILKQKATGSVSSLNIYQTTRLIPTRLDNLSFEFKVLSPIPSDSNLCWKEMNSEVYKCSFKYDTHTVELIKSEKGSAMLVHLDKKYCFDWTSELINQYNLALHYAKQAGIKFNIKVSDYGKAVKRPHIAFEEDLIALFTAASHTAEINTDEGSKAWIDSSNGLGELETDDLSYAYLYLMMPKTIDKIANSVDLILKHSGALIRCEHSYHPFLTLNN